ncbi:hypothetical protein [Parasphingorhabdus sp.]|uniref:hypothetical protein n=1 Tax=Parasphingorhabdus sp. TaxID=2709688 RepID=UPI002B274568|nr:hypothetical protein [Parasphingorhabdus sp.]
MASSSLVQPLAHKVIHRLHKASRLIGTADPVSQLSGILGRTFLYPDGDPRYGPNALTPMAAPFEPSFSETQPNILRFTIEPLPPEASGSDRRDESTRETRRLLRTNMDSDTLYWFDKASEPFRGFTNGGNLSYGAFFGSSYDRDGLFASKVYYETPANSGRIDNLPIQLHRTVQIATQLIPGLLPLFTTVAAQRDSGGQRLTFACTEALKLANLQPVLDALGLGHRLPGIMQNLGLVLGGRFEIPAHGTLLAFGEGPHGPDFEIYVLLSTIPDLPPSFLSLLTMGMAERPKGLVALERWMSAFTPEDEHWPGRFSIISLRTDRQSPPRVSLYLRPVEFELTPEMVPQAA